MNHYRLWGALDGLRHSEQRGDKDRQKENTSKFHRNKVQGILLFKKEELHCAVVRLLSNKSHIGEHRRNHGIA
jgi:hypothetical protein